MGLFLTECVWVQGGVPTMGGDGGNFANEFSWNNRAHLLVIDGPVGSSHPLGFGTCCKFTITPLLYPYYTPSIHSVDPNISLVTPSRPFS